jgi:hypothetical protein
MRFFIGFFLDADVGVKLVALNDATANQECGAGLGTRAGASGPLRRWRITVGAVTATAICWSVNRRYVGQLDGLRYPRKHIIADRRVEPKSIPSGRKVYIEVNPAPGAQYGSAGASYGVCAGGVSVVNDIDPTNLICLQAG